MKLDPRIAKVTERMVERSRPSRRRYLDLMKQQAERGINRPRMSCGNFAHGFAASGEDKDSKLDLNKLPETPVAKPVKEPPNVAPPIETKAPATPEAKPELVPTGAKGSVIQLGAFANQAQAERAWSALSARFPSVAALGKLIVPFPGGIRLRATAASPADARQVCQTLKAAGENCFIAQ